MEALAVGRRGDVEGCSSGRVRRIGGLDQLVGEAGQGAHRDGGDVIVDPTPVGVAGQVTAQHTVHVLGTDRHRWDRHVEAQHVGQNRSGVILEAGDQVWRQPGEEDRLEIVAGPEATTRGAGGGSGNGGEMWKHSGIEVDQENLNLRIQHAREELTVVFWRTLIPEVLLRHLHQQLIEQRIGQPRYLHEGAALLHLAGAVVVPLISVVAVVLLLRTLRLRGEDTDLLPAG